MTINGIGTTYFGRKNKRTYLGECASCQSHGQLTDYETGHFFSIIFVPVIPLGRKQIIAECAACNRHSVMPLKQWDTLKEETLNEGLADLGANMGDAAKALELIYNMTMFNQLTEATELAEVCFKQHDTDFDVMMQLGSWYEQMGNAAKAEKCFSQAIKLDPENPHCKRIQAVQALEQQKPQLAAEYLASLRPDSEFYDPAVFLMLAHAFQDSGMHEEALQEYRQLIQQSPQIATDKSFRKRVKALEKLQESSPTILPKAGLFS
jgi:tetratricopeptide (TPR) repeat protein